VIVEIALGIVLAVLILVFLPYIIGLGVIIIGIALILAAAATIIYLVPIDTEMGYIIILCLVIAALVVTLKDKENRTKIKSFAVDIFSALLLMTGTACMSMPFMAFMAILLKFLMPDTIIDFTIDFTFVLIIAAIAFVGLLFVYIGKKLSKINVSNSTNIGERKEG